MNAVEWYNLLNKPFWAPPAGGFSLVWYALYAIMAFSFGYAIYLFITKKIPFRVILPFILNIILNVLFEPLMFGLHNIFLASIDVILVLATLIWAMVRIYPYAAWVAQINFPQLLWLAFATVLQLSIYFLN